MKKKILSLALLYLVSVEALFPAHAFAMEGEQEVTDIYAWDDGDSGDDQAAVQEKEQVQTVDEEPVFDIQSAGTAADTAISQTVTPADRTLLPGETSGQYSITLRVDDEIAKGSTFSTYSRTGDDEYSAVFDINDVASLPDMPSKPGYEFGGWLDTDTGRLMEGTVQGYGEKTYTAVYNPYVITVKYVKNAPSGSVIGGTVPSTRTYAYNPNNPPAPTEYCYGGTLNGSTHEFAGWHRYKNCSDDPVTTLFKEPPTSDTSITLYAGWKARTYTVSTLQWGTSQSITAKEGSSSFTGSINCGKKFKTSTLVPEEKNGLTFAGWYALENSGKWTKVGSVSAKNRRDITLYAKYNADYRIVLHDTLTGETYTEGLQGLSAFGSTKLPAIKELGWGSGSGFVGWTTVKDSGYAKYGNGKKVSFKSDPEGYAEMLSAGRVLDLYTVYADEGASSRKLIFIADGKEYVSRSVSKDETFDLSDIDAPEKKGYKFLYWKDTATGKKIKSVKSGDKRPVIRMEAVYKAMKTSVKYYNNLPAGLNGKAKKASGKYTYGGKYSFRKNSFKAAGHTFCCWASDPAGEHPVAWGGGSFIDDEAERYYYDKVVGTDMKADLYAVWKPLDYTYSLDDHNNHLFRAVTVNGGDIAAGIWPVSAMQRGSDEFVGWKMYKTNKKGILVRDSDGDPIPLDDEILDKPPAANVYLFGYWKKKTEKPEGAISIEDYNATADDGIDDKDALSKAIAEASQLYDEDGKVHTVYIPAGRYNVKMTTSGYGINMRNQMREDNGKEKPSSHVRILMEEDAVIVADNSDLTDKDQAQCFSVFTMAFADDVTIEGGVIDGNRAEKPPCYKSGDDGVAGHCIDLSGATNIVIKDCTIKNAWTDGIYMGATNTLWFDEYKAGGPQKFCMGNGITVDNCTITNSRRCNIGLINADNVTIKNCKLSDANGAQPMCGIDIEPNKNWLKYDDTLKFYYYYYDEKAAKADGAKHMRVACRNITIEDTTITPFENKIGNGDNHSCLNVLYDPNEPDTVMAKNVIVKNCTFNGSVYIGKVTDMTITGTKIKGNYEAFFGGVTKN